VAEAALLDAVRAEAMLPFDLERGPLVRATLWRVHEREHVFLLAMHHIVADGWSLGILMSELGELYAASRAGEPAPLPALALSYADYADWQRESLGEEVVERHLDYWRRELAGAPTSLELFGDGLRAPGRRPARRTRIALPVPLCDAIRDLSRSEGVTPFMTLLAAFGALLSRYSGQRDLLIGSPIAGRIHPGTEGIVGFFVNSLVLRVRLEADPSFRALLARTKAACLGAYAHQALPFERLVEDLQPDRDLLRTPLFQVMFMLQNQPVGDLQLPKAEVDYLERHVESAKFDLVVALHEEGGAFVGRLDWAEDLFDAETADTIPAHFSTLLEGLVREPDRPASRHAFLTQGERQRLVVEYNRTSAPYSDERCLHQQIETHVDAAPNAVAVVAGDRRLSYTELDVRANQLAHRLATMGVRRGDRVALCLGRSVEIVVAVFGILKAGAAWVGIDPAVPRLRVAAMVRDAGAAAMVTEKSFVDLVPSGMVHLLVDEHAAELARQPHGRPAVPVAPDDLAYMLYTSGSTGEPKGACIAHRGVLSLIADIQRRAPLSPGARASFWTSIGFDVSVYEMFSALLVGAAVWVVPEELRADPDGFAEWLFEQHIDAAYVPPFGIDAFARAVERKGSTALSRLFVGVEPIPERTLARIAVRGPGLSILNSYGPTEATVCCTLYRCPPQESSERPSAIGFPTANTELYVLDEHLAPVARGATGELFIGGVGVGLGYWGRPTETAQRFLPDPFSGRPGARLYRTGDLVRMRADLALVFLGRIDRQVKLSGHRIELGEIETTLATHPAVRGAAAVVRSDGRGHDHLAAYVVPAAGEDVSPAALREHLESRLPRWMLPRAFVLMEALPLTHSGKIDRDALPDPSFDAPASEGVHRTPRDALEHALATIVAEVLGVSRVGIDDDFFALGANSLLVTQVIARARRALGVHLPLRAVFEAPTVAGLAARVATLLPRPRHSLPPARRGPQAGPLPLSFSQTRLWFLQQLEPEQVAYTIRSALRLRGPLDVDALGRSLAEIVRRHEVLRTTYLLMDGEPRQLVRDDRELQVSFSSVESLDAAGREDGARAELASDACRPFDLEHDLPLRVRLVRLGPSDHVLYLAVHHIASDGWSLDVLFRELGALYRAFGHGELSPLPELDLQYADYAVRQRQTVTSDRMETVAEGDGFASQLAYWKGALAGAPTLDLPTDRPRPRVRTTRGASCTDLIGTADRRRVQAMSVEHGVTQHMIFLATFATVLARFAAQYDLVVGTPVAGRTRAELEPLIGCFINVLPLRIDLSGDPTFRELLGRVRETALSAYANQDVPFERVLEELHPERDVGRTPVFQVSFNMFHVADERLELPEIAVEGFRAGGPTARFDLALYARDSADGVRLELVYATDLFEKQSADLLLAHVTSVLRAAATDVDQRISEVPLLDEADAARLRAGSLRARPTGPAVPFEEADLAGSIVDRFDRQVHQHHSSVAVLTRNERWTYGRLYDVSRRLAAALHAAGICEGKRVALLFDHGGAMVAGMIGVLRAGAAYVPLDRAHPSKRLALVAQDAEVAAIVTDRGGRSLAMPLANGLPVIVIDDLVEVQTLEIPPVSPRSLAYLLYTSGSTGRPKGVMQSHENVLHHIRAYTHGLRIRHDDRLTLLSTYTFDAAVMDIYGALLNGATLLSARVLDEDPSRLAAWLADEGATILHATPTVFRLLTSDLEAHSMPSVRLVVLGGEPCYRDDALLCRRVFGPGTIFVNGCGPTESTLALQHFMDGHSELRTQRAPVGHPVLDTDVYLAGADGQRLGTYGVGEIVIESQHVALGYWNQPDETRLAFESDASRPRLRRYRSGDVGRLLADGSIEFVGRKDQQLKIRGHRLEPGEIEAAIARHSSVREAAIVAASSADQRVLVAFVSAAPGETLDASELRAFLRQELPEYMLPSTIVVLPTLPLTTTGKVDRAALLAYDLPAPISTERVQPSDPLEQELADLWADVLGVGVGALDDFFDLGGHSLLALRILARVEQKFGQRLPVAAFFQAPTVRDMAVMLAGMLVSSGESGGRPPRFSEAPPRGSSER
jgi:amino acid adenylation domain-containing protein